MRQVHGSRPARPVPGSEVAMKFLGYLIFTAGLLAAPPAAAQDRLPIFDTHVHYSRDAWSEYSPARIEELFREAGVLRALVSSTPDDGTLKLFKHMPERVVPNLRPYRDGADVTSWSANQEVFDYVSGRLNSGIYRGVGEFHLFDPLEARSRQVRGLVRLAVEKDLWLQVHSGAGPVKALYAVDPRVKILWAHLGMTEPADVVMEMMDAYPEMLTETSFRGGEIGGGPDGIDPAWRDVMIKHADRIMIGSDTYITPRWGDYASLIGEHRAWLSRLPDEVARKIAYRNAVRVFGPGRGTGFPKD